MPISSLGPELVAAGFTQFLAPRGRPIPPLRHGLLGASLSAVQLCGADDRTRTAALAAVIAVTSALVGGGQAFVLHHVGGATAVTIASTKPSASGTVGSE